MAGVLGCSFLFALLGSPETRRRLDDVEMQDARCAQLLMRCRQGTGTVLSATTRLQGL
jgi:hypothetical protein